MYRQATPPGPAAGFDLGGTGESLARLRAWFAAHGDVYRVFSPSRGAYFYVINHPDDVQHVLLANHRNYTKGEGMDRVRLLLGNGIMTSEGEFWRRQRRMIQPAFHRRVLALLDTLIGEVNDKYAARWSAQAARREPLDVAAETSAMTLEIVLRSIFSCDLERLKRRLGENPFDVVATETIRDLRFAYRFRSLARLIGELAAQRRTEPRGEVDFLAMLMSARSHDTGEHMSETELVDEVMTLIVAGHETTAAALAWTWHLLGRHPDAAERLHAEADRAANERTDAAGPVRLEEAEALPFTRQVIQEALRLYPPGWLFTRRSIEADRLGGYAIGPRTDVFISPYMLHRHPAFWDAPEQFRPERFDGPDAEERHRFAYIPFSVGPRHCVGENLAMFEMLVHVSAFSRRFRLAPVNDDPVELEAQINLRPRAKLMMTVEER
ncbi:MAG TPA: cytochrome P450 [Steroidobacteraceae bacterium]|nr:cytochrome P450 [Steroidobacteraceae bacterium]